MHSFFHCWKIAQDDGPVHVDVRSPVNAIHGCCMSLNEAAVPEVSQIKVVLVKSSQQLSLHICPPWLHLQTTVLISKCEPSIYKVSENVSILLLMLAVRKTLIALGGSIQDIDKM